MNRLLGLLDRFVLRRLPPRIGGRARLHALRRMGAAIGDSVALGPGVTVLEPAGLCIEDGVTVARDTTLDCRGGLRLCAGALIGFESVILTSTHNSSMVGVRIQDQGMFAAPTVIGSRAWLGTRTVVLPGVTIGADAIVAACAVVSKDVGERCIVAGVPARRLRDR